ncbi:hypothetical protein D3C78_1218520 [compost metagenome]
MIVFPFCVFILVVFIFPRKGLPTYALNVSSSIALFSASCSIIKSFDETDTRKSIRSPRLISSTWHTGPSPCVGYKFPFLLAFSFNLQRSYRLSFEKSPSRISWMYAPSQWIISPKKPCLAMFNVSSSKKS